MKKGIFHNYITAALLTILLKENYISQFINTYTATRLQYAAIQLHYFATLHKPRENYIEFRHDDQQTQVFPVTALLESVVICVAGKLIKVVCSNQYMCWSPAKGWQIVQVGITKKISGYK